MQSKIGNRVHTILLFEEIRGKLEVIKALLVKCALATRRQNCDGSQQQMFFNIQVTLNSLISGSETFQLKQKQKRKKIKRLMAVVNVYQAQAITPNCFKVVDLKVTNCMVELTEFFYFILT